MNLLLFLILLLSLALNGVFIWYTIKVLQKLSFVYDNAISLQSVNQNFLEHIETVHEMDMFFGDETLGALIQHSKYVVEQYDNFNEVFEDLEYSDIEIPNEEIEEDAEKEEVG
tara:strand:+ start:871 stop:1209 length:339 start_codon:yes stop_codon:yes gene_type:complete